MGNACKVCGHGDREEIEKMMLSGRSHLKISKSFEGISNQNIRNHLPHLSSKLVKLEETKELLHGKELIRGLQDLMGRTERILSNAEKKNKSFISLAAIREMRAGFEFMVKLRLHIAETQTKDDLKDKEAQIRDIKKLNVQEIRLLEKLLSKMNGDISPDEDIISGLQGRSQRGYEYTSTTFESVVDDLSDADDDDKPLKRKKKKKMKRKVLEAIEADPEEEVERTSFMSTRRRLRPEKMFPNADDGSLRVL